VEGLKFQPCTWSSLSLWFGVNNRIAELGGLLPTCMVKVSPEPCTWPFPWSADTFGGWQTSCRDSCKILCTPEQVAKENHKILRIRTPVMDGFWVRAIMVLAQVHFAAKMGISSVLVHPHVNATCGDPRVNCVHEVTVPFSACLEAGFCDVYVGDKNGWDEYWEPVGLSLQAVYSSEVESQLIELHHKFAWILYMQFFRYPTVFSEAVRMRTLMADLVAKFAVVQPSVVLLAEQEWARMTGGKNRPVVGVHIRGTDKGGIVHPPHLYFPLIDEFLASFDNALIFLATDDMGYFRAVTQRYASRVVHSASTDRASDKDAIWSSGESTSSLGFQVLVDTLLLAKCTFLLKTNSAVSEFAIYYSPRLINNSFDFNIGDQHTPVWRGA